MSRNRVSLGFDLRVNADLQGQNLSQQDQRLISAPYIPISADPSVWSETEEIAALMEGTTRDFVNPLHLAKSIDLLLDACSRRGISTTDLRPVCLTTYESNIIALDDRFGPGYFSDRPREEELLSLGWTHMGFDVVDLNGLISGLKGCGYVEPTRSQLKEYFGGALNNVGLFDNNTMASQFAEVRGLQIRAHAPFVVVGLLVHNHI
jgi:hypothetical protein